MTVSINLNEAWRFLQAFAPDEPFWEFQAYDDNKDREGYGRKLRGTFQRNSAELRRLNNSCYAIGVLINVSNGNSYGCADIVRGRAVFLDLDGAALAPILNDQEIPQPHAITETSPHHFHVFWFTENIPADQLGKLEAVQRSLAQRFNGDPTACRRNQVPRLPGFVHNKVKRNKVSPPFVSRLCHLSAAPRCKLEDFFSVLTEEDVAAVDQPHQSNGKIEDEPDKIIAALEVIPNDGLVDWRLWNKIGLAAHRASGGDAKVAAAFDQFSKKDAGKYDAKYTRKIWCGLAKAKTPEEKENKKVVGAATLFYLADQADPRWRDRYDEINREKNAEILRDMFAFARARSDASCR